MRYRRTNHIWGIAVVLLSIVAACEPVTTDVAALPPRHLSLVESGNLTPDFIRRIFVSDTFIGIVLDELAIWQPGNRAQELGAAIQASIVITIDGQPVPDRYLEFESAMSTIGVLSDDQKDILGSYGDLTIYIDTSDNHAYSAGLHTGVLSLVGLSGIPFSYEWEFYIEENDDT